MSSVHFLVGLHFPSLFSFVSFFYILGIIPCQICGLQVFSYHFVNCHLIYFIESFTEQSFNFGDVQFINFSFMGHAFVFK